MKKIGQYGVGHLVLLLVIVVIAGIAGAAYYVISNKDTDDGNSGETFKITNFEECAAAGNPIMESYPERCAADGQTFTREINESNEPAVVNPVQ